MVERRPCPDVTVVTGAAGWLGRALVAALLDRDDPDGRPGRLRAVVGPGDDTAGLPEDARLDVVRADVREPSSVRELFAGLTGDVDVIHAAGVIHPASMSDFVEVNTRGTQHVAALARSSGVRRMVHISSNSPFGVNPHPGDRFRNDEPYDPYMGYGRSKMLAELRLLDEVEKGLDAVIVRPPWFYGPHQPARQTTFFTLVRAGRFPLLGDGRQRRSMVFVDNLVQGAVLAELTDTAPGRGWWIADERPYELNEILAAVTDALAAAGLRIAHRQTRLPALVGRLAERADALVQRTGRYVAQLHVLGEMDKTIACDISVATAELGYRPTVELVEGMRRSVAWCLAHGIDL